jgi:4-nitrophenyl phosphatase
MIKAVILDLDGTVYWGRNPVPGAPEFINWLGHNNIKHLFVTNRSNRIPEIICNQLRDFGLYCNLDDVLTASQATAQFIESGSAYYIGEDGLRQAFDEQGITITDQSPDYVVVGYDRQFNYDKLEKACRLIQKGAKFLATNPDQALQTEDGLSPGTGAIVAAVAAGCGTQPIIIGKPEKLIIEMALQRLAVSKDETLVVGDNVDTDIPAGENAGVRSVLLLTGVSTREEAEAATAKPTWIAQNFDELRLILDEARKQ